MFCFFHFALCLSLLSFSVCVHHIDVVYMYMYVFILVYVYCVTYIHIYTYIGKAKGQIQTCGTVLCCAVLCCAGWRIMGPHADRASGGGRPRGLSGRAWDWFVRMQKGPGEGRPRGCWEGHGLGNECLINVQLII